MAVMTRSVAAFSWIDPQTGLPEVDTGGHPGATTTRGTILGEIAYRFSNFLEAEIETDDETGRMTRANFTNDSDMYRSPSYMRIPSAPVGNIGRSCQLTDNRAIFRQIVGCRTISPETIGTGAGGIIGGGGALAVGAFVLGTGGWSHSALVGSYLEVGPVERQRSGLLHSHRYGV